MENTKNSSILLNSFIRINHWRVLYSKKKKGVGLGRRGLGSLKMKLFQKTGGNRSTLDSKLAPLTSDVMASFCIYAKESATPLSQPPKVCETQFQDTDPTGQRIMLSERNHMRLQHVKEVHDWRRMLWANRRYTQDKHGLDHML